MQSVAELLASKIAGAPDAEHVRYRRGDEIASLTRRSFGAMAGAGAAHLAAAWRVRPGERVGLVCEKSVAQMRAFFSIFSTGATAVPVAEELPAAELAFIFADADLKLILASRDHEEKVRAAAGAIPVVPLETIPEGGEGDAYEPGPARPDDTACIIYTSGSTGRPKGVMLSHRNFLANSASSARLIDAGQGDVVMSVLPYWHSFGLTVELFTLLQVAGAVAIPKDKRDFGRNLAAYRPTIVLLVPRIAEVLKRGILDAFERLPSWKRRLLARALGNAERVCTDDPRDGGMLLDRLLRRLYLATVLRPVRRRFGDAFRFFVSGGAPLDREYQVLFKRLGVPIYQGYGLTEATPVISAGCPRCHRVGTSGKIASWLLPEEGGDFTFEAPDGRRGKDLRGELLVRGACVMQGYFRRERETAEALRDGWLHTGDVGWVDADNFLSLSGRRSSLICLVGGEKFHPEPIEERLKTSPLFADCIVYGEGRKNAYALLVANPDATAGMGRNELADLARREIERLLADAPPHWRPKDFMFVDPFTVEAGLLTSTLKVKRNAILRQCAREVEAIDTRNGEARIASPAGER